MKAVLKAFSHMSQHKQQRRPRAKTTPGITARMFLIGPGEVGKTTIIKQMQKLCIEQPDMYSMWNDDWTARVDDPLNEELRRNYVHVVHQNTVRAIGTLIQQAAAFGYAFTSEADVAAADEIMTMIEHEVGTVHAKEVVIDARLAATIERLRHGGGNAPIVRTLERINEFYLPDSADYFLRPTTLARVCRPDYVPTEVSASAVYAHRVQDDMIRVRAPTVDQQQFNFIVHRMHMSIHDMGGQITELKKIGTFLPDWLRRTRPGDVNFIWFIASLADYNKPAIDADGHAFVINGRAYTKLDEAVSMFEVGVATARMTLLQAVCNQRLTAPCRVMLFLNKHDVFRARITMFADDLARHYPLYRPPATGRGAHRSDDKRVDHAYYHVCHMFAAVYNDSCRNDNHTPLFVRPTTAVQTSTMDTLFGAVKFELMTSSANNGPIS